MERSNDEEGLDPLRIGKLRYSKKNYEGALLAFTEAIKHSSAEFLLIALDHRAATYEKLDQLQTALRDSKKMIDHMPGSARGYLRCAKVLQLRGDTKLALKIYERGLIKVKVGSDKDRPLLETLCTKLQRSLAPKVDFNPLIMLPTELAVMVCRYLDSNDLAKCLRVHSTWKLFLESQPDLWLTINIKNPINQNSLRAHLRRSKYALTSAVIRWNPTNFDMPKLRYLTKTCKDLERLEFQLGFVGESLLGSLPLAGNLRSLVLSYTARITLAHVEKALHQCTTLTVAEFHHIDPGEWTHRCVWKCQLPNLRKIALGVGQNLKSNIFALDLAGLSTVTPNLVDLCLSKWESLQQIVLLKCVNWPLLKVLRVQSMPQITGIAAIPSTLQVLDIYRLTGLRYFTVASPGTIEEWRYLSSAGKLLPFFQLPELVELDLTGTSIDWTVSKKLLPDIPSTTASKLKTLKLGVPDDCIGPMDDVFPVEHLEEVSLAEWRCSEDELLRILRKFPNTKRISLSKTKATGVTIKELMTRKSGRPEWLDLSDCYDISSDAIEYALGQGVQITRKSSTAGYSRGLRGQSLRSR